MNMNDSESGRNKGKGVLLPRCYICGEVPEEGIRGGIKLKRAFICTRCEQDIIAADVGSSQYRRLLEKIKMILK